MKLLINFLQHSNWGHYSAWAGAWLSFSSAVGYLLIKDYRRAVYFFFGFCITATIAWR